MSRIDLNIVDRGVQGSEWTAEYGCLTVGSLDEVVEQKTDNSSALNSLPTPFARFFVAREAFRRVTEEHIHKEKESGFAYRQLVSDILDVYELLFNLKYHRNTWNAGEKLEIREWDSKENLSYIKNKMPVLFNSVGSYYPTDINEEKLYFVVYTEGGKDKLLACSSPMTGFVTPPDMDKSQIRTGGQPKTQFMGGQYEGLEIRRKSGGRYFHDTKLFEDRDPEFKNYMFNELFGPDTVSKQYKAIKDYIISFRNEDPDIRNDNNLSLVPVQTDHNEDLVINGLSLKSSDEIDINSYFTDTLIRLPYRIDRERFSTVNYTKDKEDRVFDYLLPFKPAVKELFANQKIDTSIRETRNSVSVSLNYKGKTYKKEYSEDAIGSGQGHIYCMDKAKIIFDLAVFPNILSANDDENNYFKILLASADEHKDARSFNIDQISLSFFKQGSSKPIYEIDPTSAGASFGVRPAVVRSHQKPGMKGCSTKFYELFNSSFDMIEVNVQGKTGLIIPVWGKSEATNDAYTYAIDFGTSNTFLSRCKNNPDGTPDLSRKPELFRMERQMVSYLHQPSNEDQYSLPIRIENSIFDLAQDSFKTEFIPPLIDGSIYKFPIRTALCGVKNTADEPRLFDNHNIAFFYEKQMATEDQAVHTDIKWDTNDALLRVYIRELLLIIKCDILQRNGNLKNTHLVWFRPLSFQGNIRSTYNEIWKDESKRILSISENQIDCYSESEAPYYYFKNNNIIYDSSAVSIIDIGGGSTDFVYFQDNKPLFANSVHFGCDVLWGNGFNEYGNARENGIYQKYANTLNFRKDGKNLEKLNLNFKNFDGASTKDIINFWLSNSDYCDIKKKLSQDFKPVFVYHLTSIIFYLASLCRDNKMSAPKTIVFSGNGSKYIDSFICSDKALVGVAIGRIINHIFTQVLGGEHDIHLELPDERKESTCYGGLYRDKQAEPVKERVYQGDVAADYETVGKINANYHTLRTGLMEKYSTFNKLYKDVLDMLKGDFIIENTSDTKKYSDAANKDMGTPLDTYYKTQVKERYQDEVILYDSVFFLPIINRVFELTRI